MYHAPLVGRSSLAVIQVPPDLLNAEPEDEEMRDPDVHEGDDKVVQPDNEYYDDDKDNDRDSNVLDV